MRKRAINLGVGITLVGIGVVFGILFPKKQGFVENFLATDSLMSIAITVALIGTGLIVMTTQRATLCRGIMVTLLLCSVLLNCVVVAIARDCHQRTKIILKVDVAQQKQFLEKLQSGNKAELESVKKGLQRDIEVKTDVLQAMK